MKTNALLLYQNGVAFPTQAPLNGNFEISWSRAEAGKYFGTFDYPITEKGKVVCEGFNHIKGGSFFTDATDTYKISIEVSDEVNGIVLLTEKNGVWSDGVLDTGYFGNFIRITDYSECEYTALELSKLSHAKSILYGSGSEKLIELANTLQ